MLDREDIRKAEEKINRLHRSVHEAFAHRNERNTAFVAWEMACQELHTRITSIDFLSMEEFHQRLRYAESEAVEDAILYLEVDPWHFGSGYLKERLIRRLKPLPLGEGECRRLQNVVWNVAHGRNGREFRNFCSLAGKFASRDFVEKVEGVSHEENQSTAGKLHYLRDYLRRRAASAD